MKDEKFEKFLRSFLSSEEYEILMEAEKNKQKTEEQ